MDDPETGTPLDTVSEIKLKSEQHPKTCTLFDALLTIASFHPLNSALFKTSEDIKKEKIRHRSLENWYVIHPCSAFNYGWQIIMSNVYIFLVLLNILYANVVATFDKVLRCKLLPFIIVFNCLGILNVLLNFVTGYVDYDSVAIKDQTMIILSKSKIASKYMKSFFIIDLISLWNILYIALIKEAEENRGFLCCTICIQLLQMFRFKTVFENVRIFLREVSYRQYIIAIIVWLFMLFFGCYFFTNVLILVKKFTNEQQEMVSYCQLFHETILDVWRAFLIKVFYIRTIDSDTEKYILYLAATYSGICQTVLFVSIGKIIFEHTVLTKRTRISKEDINTFLNQRTRIEIQQYLINQNILENQTLDKLLFKILRSCHYLRPLPRKTIMSLIRTAKLDIFTPGQTIAKIGLLNYKMFFIIKGKVALYNSSKKEICRYRQPEYFGICALLNLPGFNRHYSNVLALEETILLSIHQHDFIKIVQPDSIQYKKILQLCEQRLNFIVKNTNTTDA